MRAVDGTKRKDRRKKITSQAKGFWGRRGTNNRIAKAAVMKAGTYAFRDRRATKRNIRSLWITRISAAVHMEGLNYSQFMHALKIMNVNIDRKALSNMAIEDKNAFSTLVSQAKGTLKA